jgi:hypothetical protein
MPAVAGKVVYPDQVLLPEDLEMGEFANGYRVVKEGGHRFLDFLVYSPREGVAKVVSRVKASPELLKRLGHHLVQEEVPDGGHLLTRSTSG